VFQEDDLLPLSALQHLLFCERQCGLIHIERVWRDNSLTLEGAHMHRRVDGAGPGRERRGDVIVVRGVALRSLRLGLSGRADLVEFYRGDDAAPASAGVSARLPGVALAAAGGRWLPFPVDYKHGQPKANRCDEVQLCAQALCIEEMLQVAVPRGALFYGKTQRRLQVAFGASLREETAAAAARLHELVASGTTPTATWEHKCRGCSLLDWCLPGALQPPRTASRYMREAITAALAQRRRAGTES